MKDIAVLIPALDPDTRLIEYCRELKAAGIETIILVNDGSDEEHGKIFDELRDECIILTHAVNYGKGRALKDAFTFIYDHSLTDFVTYDSAIEYDIAVRQLSHVRSVVTADCDGQHTVKDIMAVGRKALSDSGALILGARDFDADNVPFKSRKGNKITRQLFRLLHGLKLTDTQTGLRGIPIGLIPAFLQGKGDRFEYELDMLVIAAGEHIPVVEVPIETIYEDGNTGTHFRAVADSISVYKILFGTFFKFLLTSLTSFVLDILIFRLMLAVLRASSDELRISVATVTARIISSVYNFLMNKQVVFIKDGNMLRSALGYYTLCISQMAASAGLVILLHYILPIPETCVKIIVDSLLFVISYQIQKRIVFKK